MATLVHDFDDRQTLRKFSLSLSSLTWASKWLHQILPFFSLIDSLSGKQLEVIVGHCTNKCAHPESLGFGMHKFKPYDNLLLSLSSLIIKLI